MQWLVHVGIEAILQYLLLLLPVNLEGIVNINSQSPPSCWICLMVGFAIIPYPISIHGQAKDLLNLIQQNFLCDIVSYAPKYLFLKQASNFSKFSWLKLIWMRKCTKFSDEHNLPVSIEIIRSWFICSDSHKDPFLSFRIPWTLNNLSRI